jgi:hypothetical protein
VRAILETAIFGSRSGAMAYAISGLFWSVALDSKWRELAHKSPKCRGTQQRWDLRFWQIRRERSIPIAMLGQTKVVWELETRCVARPLLGSRQEAIGGERTSYPRSVRRVHHLGPDGRSHARRPQRLRLQPNDAARKLGTPHPPIGRLKISNAASIPQPASGVLWQRSSKVARLASFVAGHASQHPAPAGGGQGRAASVRSTSPAAAWLGSGYAWARSITCQRIQPRGPFPVLLARGQSARSERWGDCLRVRRWNIMTFRSPGDMHVAGDQEAQLACR